MNLNEVLCVHVGEAVPWATGGQLDARGALPLGTQKAMQTAVFLGR